jgi:hypothetical protein
MIEDHVCEERKVEIVQGYWEIWVRIEWGRSSEREKGIGKIFVIYFHP